MKTSYYYFILGGAAAAFGFSSGDWYATVGAGGVASVVVAIAIVIF